LSPSGTTRSFEPLPKTRTKPVEVHLLQREPADLARPQAAGVNQLEHRPVADGVGVGAGRAGEQFLHLAGREGLRQLAADLRAGEEQRGIIRALFFVHEVAVKHADRAQLAGLGGGAEILIAEPVQPRRQVFGRHFLPAGHPMLLQEVGSLLQVALVGLGRVARQAALQLKIAEKKVDPIGKGRRSGRHGRLLGRGPGLAAFVHGRLPTKRQ
jgi:hypothetical protein